MDASLNPFAPSAGYLPPELAGRDEELKNAKLSITRIAAGRHAQSAIFVGLRGVGKTVLLLTIRKEAEHAGHKTAWVEADANKRLTDILAPALFTVLLSLSTTDKATAVAKSALGTIRNFMSAFKVEVECVSLQVNNGEPMSGNLHHDLTTLFQTIGKAAKEEGRAVVILIDEIQYLGKDDLSALIQALHRVSQDQLPVTLFGAGLSGILEKCGDAKSYAERLFTFRQIGRLSDLAARRALEKPVSDLGCSFTPDALGLIVEQTQGYPFYLQEWGSHCWQISGAPVFDVAVAIAATASSLAKLDNDHFKVRIERTSPSERTYMAGLASLGPGPHASGEVAKAIGRKVNEVSVVREALIKKGHMHAPGHGLVEFTVPLFDGYVRRVYPLMCVAAK